MSNFVLIKSYAEPPLSKREILRYAGCKTADKEITAALEECISEVKNKLTYKACYIKLPASVTGEICDFGAFRVSSEKLALNLKGADEVIVFAATIGIEIDRLIAKYSHISPARSVLFQAIGAERIEALCDVFCKDMSESLGGTLSSRFSAGYGDLPLDTQREIFKLLNCSKHIGITLNESLIMSPTKSVTAFAGIKFKTEVDL